MHDPADNDARSPGERLLRVLLPAVFRRLDAQREEAVRLQDRLESYRGTSAQELAQARDESAQALAEARAAAARELAQTRDQSAHALAEARNQSAHALAEARAAAARELAQAREEWTRALADHGAEEARERARAAGEAGEAIERARARLDGLESRLAEAQAQREASGAAVEAHLASLGAGLAALRGELEQGLRVQAELSSGRADRLETRVARIEDPAAGWADYSAFEDRFRGAEAVIRERQAVYLPLARGRTPVADLGCGRGEFLAVLRDAGIESLGVDGDATQVRRCREQGLLAEQGELIAWLEARPPRSLGAIFLLQVIEHLDFAAQRRAIELAHQRLFPGGLLLIETVNPHCPEALEWFYIDPTHRRPFYPEMANFLLERSGFTKLETRFQIPCSTAPQDEPPTHRTGADFAAWGIRP